MPTAAVPPLPEAATIAEVLQNLDTVLDWATQNESKIGYFAVLYKRVTLGIQDGINAGIFDDGPRVERLDVEFARRYFTALNAFFHPDRFSGLTLPWEVAFVGDENDNATMLQHMLASLNVHITFDLAPATLAAMSGVELGSLEADFNRVNALLCSQIPGMLDKVEHISPTVLWMRRLIPNEVFFLQRALTKMRRAAWLFAIFVALNPGKTREKEVNQAAWSSALSAWYLDPPSTVFGTFPRLVRAIAKREHADVADNIRYLLEGADQPAAMDVRFMPAPRRYGLLSKLSWARATSAHPAADGSASTAADSSAR